MRAPWPMLVVSLWASMIAHADAATFCVNPGGTGGCFSSIDAAMNVTGPGDEIEVAAGTYVENLDVFETREKIRGAGVGATILQGGIDVQLHGNLTLSGITMDGAGGYGLIADAESYATLTDCEITGYSYGVTGAEPYVVTLTNTTVHDNTGYGVFVWGDPGDTPPRLNVVRSTISGNGTFGVIVDDGGVITRIEDSTISGNGDSGIQAGGYAGRLKIRVRRSTIAGNARGIVDNTPPEVLLRVQLDGTIVADSTAGPDVIGPDMKLVSRGYNLIEALDPGTTLSGNGPDLLGVDPVLGPLQNNGGPTETHELLAGSPALEANPRTGRCRQPDQRGVPRLPVPCDIGAYEAP